MDMFTVRGADQKEYGPVGAEVLKQWIAQGRVRAQTPVRLEGQSEWKPVSSFPEFGAALAGSPGLTPMPGAPAPLPTGVAPQTSGLAVASLVLGLLGCLGITALAGLALGIAALAQINRSRGRLQGRGLAIGGICVSGIMLLLATLFLTATMVNMSRVVRAPVHQQNRPRPRAPVVDRTPSMSCVNNVKQISLGIRLYASAHEEALPPAATWCDAIVGELSSPRVLCCPAHRNAPRSSYAFNARLDGQRVDKVNPQTVLVFECAGGWNVSGGPEDIRTYHQNNYTVGFVDGSVRQVPSPELPSLRWEP
jgi:hypothetical protein